MMTFPPPPILFNTYCLQPQPLPRPAKVADIYDCCNELLSSSVYDEIPIDLLEEQVEDKLQEAGMTLPDVRRGTNFFDLVDRASNTHINGHLTNGRLCRNTGPPTFHPSGPVHSSHGPSYNEPPPPYRPPSAMLQFRQNMSAPALPQKDEGYLVDSSDEEQNSYPQTRHTAKISRFSVHGMNTDSSAPNLSRGMSNLNFHNMTPAEREEELKVRLVEKYCLKNEPHVAGNHEETLIQMAALRECQDRWGAAIRRMPEFLYLMKIWWLTRRHISLSDLDKDFLDRIVDPKGKSQLEWRLFGIYVDDLIQLEILVLAAKTEQNDQGDRLTVNRCIQLLNLFPFDHNGLAQKVYAHLEYETETGIASIEQLSRKFGRSRDDICDRVLQYAEVMSIQFESNSVKLNPQLPFFVLLNH